MGPPPRAVCVVLICCSVKVLHQLAEGGFGYVYLVQDRRTEEQYALKKMLCQTDEHVGSSS